MKLLNKVSKKMTLRSKINWLVFLDLLIVLILIMLIFSYIIVQVQFEETGQRALTEAKIIANMPQIINAFGDVDPSATIQPLTRRFKEETGAEFIVVGNMKLIRYSHPNPLNIGQKMVGDDDEQVLRGYPSITQAVGTLGLSVRGKAPIFDTKHHQIGVVSVGFLVEDIWDTILVYLSVIVGLGALGLGIGLFGAYLLSGHVKKQILNMEPSEIAFLVQEQAAILESIREGVLAVDSQGIISTCNQEGKRLLGLETSDVVVGKSIKNVVPNSRLPEVLTQGTSQYDQPMIIGNTLIIVNRTPVILKEEVIGAVSTFRDKMQLDQIDQRMADIGKYLDALRSQRHEFMNRLHTISGLITIEEYDLARELIDKVNDEQQRVLDFFMARIRDPAVVGILIGKLHRANELGIQFVIDPKSHLLDSSPLQELVVTILGNAIENSFEALADWNVKTRDLIVTVYISDENDQLTIRVNDSGPGVNPELVGRVFEDGVTTKGYDRGFGLSLLFQRVSNNGGKITLESSGDGTVLKVCLPKLGGV